MLSEQNILPLIKEKVLELLPDARVLLFGSRVAGNVHPESDWDILILTKNRYPKATKWAIHDKLFPLSVQFGTFINIVLVHENDWNTNAGYYSLRTNIGGKVIAA